MQLSLKRVTGNEVLKFIPEIAKLRIEIFSEWPYLYEGDLEYEMKYLKKFAECKESVMVVAFDNDQVIGVSSGLPLSDEDEAVKKPFKEGGEAVEDYFYFSESVLKKSYRGHGLGSQFFKEREEHVKHLGRFKKICFCAVVREKDDPRKPEDYFQLDSFWERKGYAKRDDRVCYFSWKEHGMEEETTKPLCCWSKVIK